MKSTCCIASGLIVGQEWMCLYKYEPLFLDPPRVNDGKLLESKLKNWVVLAHYSCIPLSTSLHERIVFSQYCGKIKKPFLFSVKYVARCCLDILSTYAFWGTKYVCLFQWYSFCVQRNVWSA